MHILKIIALTLSIAIIATCIFCFSGCTNAENAFKVIIDGEDQPVKLSQVNSDTWYIDLTLKDNSSVTLYDDKGNKHTAKVNEAGKYTILLNKDGKNYSVETRKEKKAIIWVTALLSGGLYDQDSGLAVWDPLPYEDITLKDFIASDDVTNTVVNLITRLLFSSDSDFNFETLAGPILNGDMDETNLFWNLGFDNDGNPNNANIVPANDFDNKIQYGVLGAYVDHSADINARYNLYDCEFKVFNYDWRFDCALGASALEDYIEQNKYTDVVLFSHSMGGNVVANYLARNDYNRTRTVKYVSMGGAFLGSYDALYTMENLENYFMSVLDGMGMDINSLLSSTPSLIKNIINGIDIKAVINQIQDFIINLDTFVQLLPSYDLISGKQYGVNGDGDAITIDGNAITSAEELYSFYESRPWAWKKDSEGEYVMDGDKHVIRDIVKNLRDFHESMYVTLEDNTKVFSTTLVDTVYVTGSGIVSFCGADYNSNDGVITFRTSTNGDLQVLFYSTIVNLDENELAQNDKLIIYKDFNHLQVGCDWNLIQDVVYKQIDDAFGFEIS